MKFNNETIRAAVRHWIINESSAIETYGHISNWDVSKVTNMYKLFKNDIWEHYNKIDTSNFNDDISNWDVSNVTDMSYMFSDAQSFNQPIGNWDVRKVTNMKEMFYGAKSFNQPIGDWNVSSVTDMGKMFFLASSFNQPIGNWNVSSETNLERMFSGLEEFNQPLNNWVKNYYVKNTFYTVQGTEKLATESKFNLKGEIILYKEFHKNGQLKLQKSYTNEVIDDGEVIIYRQDGSKEQKVNYLTGEMKGVFWDWWKNGKVKYKGYYENGLYYIEEGFDKNGIKYDLKLTKFDNESLIRAVSVWLNSRTIAENTYGHISNWDVSNVTNMGDLFNRDRFIKEASYSRSSYFKSLLSKFNDDISNWDVSKVRVMKGMFKNAKSFNQPIGNWDVSKVTNMKEMFRGTNGFNQPIGNWDVSKVTNMKGMFSQAGPYNEFIGNCRKESFNQPIGNWDVSKVTIMKEMFYGAKSFNQPIGDWDVSSVTDMEKMFDGAESFNQPIGDWDVSSGTNMVSMFFGASSFNQDLSKWPKKNTIVEFRSLNFSKEFAKKYDIDSLTKRNIITLNKDSKKAVAKIKKLFKSRDYNYIDSAIELIRSLEDKYIYEYFLDGIKIKSDGTLVRTKIFSGSRQAQPYFDYALISLINFAPVNLTIHESIKRKNIKNLTLSAKEADSIYIHTKDIYNNLPDCGEYTANQLPDLAFENLEEITLYNYINLESLKFLINCKKLEKIELTCCDNIKDTDLFKKQLLINE